MLCHGKNSKDGVHSLSEPLRVIEVVGVALLFAEVLKAEPWAKKLGPGANCLWKCWWAASSVRALWFIAFEISGVGYINSIYNDIYICEDMLVYSLRLLQILVQTLPRLWLSAWFLQVENHLLLAGLGKQPTEAHSSLHARISWIHPPPHLHWMNCPILPLTYCSLIPCTLPLP